MSIPPTDQISPETNEVNRDHSQYGSAVTTQSYGMEQTWQPAKPRLRPLRLLISWIVAAASLYVAASLLRGVHVNDVEGAFLVAALIAVINAVLPPLVAALRLPYMLAFGFVL